MTESDGSTGGVPRRVIALIVAGILVTLVSSGVLLYSRLSAVGSEQFEAVPDFLAAPETIEPRVRAVSEVLIRLELGRSAIDIVDGTGQRHSISQNGNWTREESPVEGGKSFPLAELDFSAVPAIVASATARAGTSPTQLVAERVEGELRWRVRVPGEGGVQVLDYGLDGAPLP